MSLYTNNTDVYNLAFYISVNVILMQRCNWPEGVAVDTLNCAIDPWSSAAAVRSCQSWSRVHGDGKKAGQQLHSCIFDNYIFISYLTDTFKPLLGVCDNSQSLLILTCNLFMRRMKDAFLTELQLWGQTPAVIRRG